MRFIRRFRRGSQAGGTGKPTSLTLPSRLSCAGRSRIIVGAKPLADRREVSEKRDTCLSRRVFKPPSKIFANGSHHRI
jgi:hypothetical protein